MMSTTSLTLVDRGEIKGFINEGRSIGWIALRLGCSKSTVDYELHRVQPYDPYRAQRNMEMRRSHCGRHSILTGALKSTIEDNLKGHDNPETIAHEIHLSPNDIYNWIYHDKLSVGVKALPEQGRRRKRQIDHRGWFPRPHNIHMRSPEVNKRLWFGNWEFDTILSPRGEAKACLMTGVERKTRLLWVSKIPNRTHGAFSSAFHEFMKHFEPYVASVTTDNGREFSHNYELEYQYKIPFYFCDPYSPWERGTNERMNRKVREFFPKKTDFSQISQSEVMDVADKIDHTPMKTLNYRTPIEAFKYELTNLNRSNHF